MTFVCKAEMSAIVSNAMCESRVSEQVHGKGMQDEMRSEYCCLDTLSLAARPSH